MNPVDLGRWSEIRAQFDELVDLDPMARGSRLAILGTVDPELGHAVESLLATDPVADELLSHLQFGAADLLFAPSDPVSVVDPLGLVGRTISHFRILEPVAAGGMGVVYLAEDTRLNRRVALKFPLPYQAVDKAAKERFLAEARSAGMLDHPNLCSVYEADESEVGHWFLAMPFYAGETLKTRLARQTPLPVHEALEIARQIAAGLACAHPAGIVHRDLKPGNLMLLPDGTVKILDFGLAKISDFSRTASAGAIGTAGYMAPEQISGEAIDGRTDLWSLGVVLYEMIAGERPFSGDNDLSLAHSIMHDVPARPSLRRCEVSRDVDTLVLTLLQKNPAHRYARAEAAMASIEAIIRGGKPAFPPGARRRAKRWVRTRGRGAKVGLSVLAVLLIAALALGTQLVWPSSRHKPTRNAEAYDLFLRGQEYEARAWTVHDWNDEWLKAAETLYRRALDDDPRFALARAQLANVLANRQFDTRQRTPAGLEEMRREAEAALRLKPELGEAHLVMSFYWEIRGNHGQALVEAKHALRASPRNPEINSNLGGVYARLGRWDDAVRAYRAAINLDPKRTIQLARLYAHLRRHADAVRAYDQYLTFVPDDYAARLFKANVFLKWSGTADSLSAVLRRVPDEWDPSGVATWGRITAARIQRRPRDALMALAKSRHVIFNNYDPLALVRGMLYSEAGDSARALADYETARRMLEDSTAAHPENGYWRIALARALAGSGRSGDAIREADHALVLIDKTGAADAGPDIMIAAAAVFAAIHENDRAIDLLEKLLQSPDGGARATSPLLRVDPTWDPLRNDPRFQNLITD